jgi:hypothetical protein
MNKGTIEYLVKWRGYGSEENQWRTTADFDSLKVIKQYWKGKVKPKKLEKNKGKKFV